MPGTWYFVPDTYTQAGNRFPGQIPLRVFESDREFVYQVKYTSSINVSPYQHLTQSVFGLCLFCFCLILRFPGLVWANLDHLRPNESTEQEQKKYRKSP